MIRFTCEGKEFEFRGEYRLPVVGDQFLNISGIVNVPANANSVERLTEPRAIVHPVLVIHEFGGIKFVETGEKRQAGSDEWFLGDNDMPIYVKHSTAGFFPILKRYEE